MCCFAPSTRQKSSTIAAAKSHLAKQAAMLYKGRPAILLTLYRGDTVPSWALMSMICTNCCSRPISATYAGKGRLTPSRPNDGDLQPPSESIAGTNYVKDSQKIGQENLVGLALSVMRPAA